MHNELLKIGPFTIYGYGLMIAIGIFAAYTLAEYRARRLEGVDDERVFGLTAWAVAGGLAGYGYGLMIAIGIFAAYTLAEYRARRLEGVDDERVFGLTAWAVAGGLAGGKVMYYITILPQIISDPSLLYRDLLEGFVIYGALIGGFVGIWLYCRKWKLNLLSYLDLALPSVALAQGFGRIGCLLAGCCYGMETDSAFCIIFQESAYAPNGIPLIPTQIISSVLDFAHFAVLIWFVKKWKKKEGQVTGLYFVLYSAGRIPLIPTQIISSVLDFAHFAVLIWFVKKWKKKEGQVTGLYFVLYSAGRFILEFFRGDLERGNVGSLSTSQFISIFTFAAGIGLLLWLGRRKKEDG